ncbi:MAG TPA: glycine cleavage system protein GcvH [Candidatus Thermoplasmatota archaeon]|nr:glycine cleavage system protein GcvH [Candidatus Thermoplasmatota archaeon]
MTSNVPADRKYTKDHEWAKDEGQGMVRVGITDFAQHSLTDIVFVELPKVGAKLEQGKPFGVVESVKSASDLYAPLSGEVVEVNKGVVEAPETVNKDPYGGGWMLVLKVAGGSGHLMEPGAYRKHIGE